MAYGSNSLGQENALSYPYPKWHPYYGWGWGAGAPRQPTGMIGDPGISPVGYGGPPGNWFGRPVVGAAPTPSQPPELIALSAAGGAGVGYLVSRSALGALVGGGLGALALLTSTYVLAQIKQAMSPDAPYNPIARHP